MDANEAAARLGVSPRRIRAMIAAGQIVATKHGRGWVIDDLVEPRTRRPLSARSRLLLAKALHTRTLSDVRGQDLARTAARIRELRASQDPAKLLADWWGGVANGPLNFGTNLVQHAIDGDKEYVSDALHRGRREYLRKPTDLADVVRSERRIRGLTSQQLADAAEVPVADVRDLERAAPMTSPGVARRVLGALDVEPTALPDLVAS